MPAAQSAQQQAVGSGSTDMANTEVSRRGFLTTVVRGPRFRLLDAQPSELIASDIERRRIEGRPFRIHLNALVGSDRIVAKSELLVDQPPHEPVASLRGDPMPRIHRFEESLLRGRELATLRSYSGERVEYVILSFLVL